MKNGRPREWKMTESLPFYCRALFCSPVKGWHSYDCVIDGCTGWKFRYHFENLRIARFPDGDMAVWIIQRCAREFAPPKSRLCRRDLFFSRSYSKCMEFYNNKLVEKLTIKLKIDDDIARKINRRLYRPKAVLPIETISFVRAFSSDKWTGPCVCVYIINDSVLCGAKWRAEMCDKLFQIPVIPRTRCRSRALHPLYMPRRPLLPSHRPSFP